MNKTVYKQTDERWRWWVYPKKGWYLNGCGCGCLSIFHCAIELPKYKKQTVMKVMKPVYEYMKQYATCGNGTYRVGITNALKHFGFEDVTRNESKPMSYAFERLNKGSRVGVIVFVKTDSKGRTIPAVGPDGTCWTTGGHYIAFTAYKVQNGKHYFYMKDSAGRNHSGWYCYETSMRGCVADIWTAKIPEETKNEKPKNSQGENSEKSSKKEEKKVYKAIDVSEHQGTIDWDKVKKAGIDAAIIRYAEGTYLDPLFDKNMKAAIKAGVHVGAYIYSHASNKTEAEKEATRLYDAASKYDISMPLYIDLEVKSLRTKADVVAPAFLEKMKSLGAVGGVYANLTWWNNYLTNTASKYSDYPFWIAQYNTRMTHRTPSLFGMWQYTDTGTVSGIKGDACRDELYTAYWEREMIKKKDDSEKKTDEKPALPASLRLCRTAEQCRKAAVEFGKGIARDNSFHYGHGKDAHHNGCYICETQPKSKKNAGIKDYKKTYCCNPFVHACYAHGAYVPAMLKVCQKGSSYGFLPSEGYAKSSLFKKIKASEVDFGDVGCSNSHVVLAIDKDRIVEASGGDDNVPGSESWNNSIHIRSKRDMPRWYRFVGKVDAVVSIRKGEYSSRVFKLQKFLNWYFGKNVVAEDRFFMDETEKYIKKYQEKRGLPVNGKCDTKTLKDMKAVVK